MWVWPQLPFGGSPPSPHCDWKTLPSSHSPSLPTPLALVAMLPEGAEQPGVREGSQGTGGGGKGPCKGHFGPDPHLEVLVLLSSSTNGFWEGFVEKCRFLSFFSVIFQCSVSFPTRPVRLISQEETANPQVSAKIPLDCHGCALDRDTS